MYEIWMVYIVSDWRMMLHCDAFYYGNFIVNAGI